MAGHETQDSESDVWLRRQALQIVMQLPDDQAEALQVLDYARGLVTEYLGKAREPAAPIPLFSVVV